MSPKPIRICDLWRIAVTGFAVVFGLTVFAATARADGFQDMNAIIRGLAPIEYLPEHRGPADSKRRSMDLDILFELSSAILTPEAERQLDQLAAAMQSKSLRLSRFRIAGHTDATGGGGYNQALSERRAVAVKDYLVARRKMDAARLETIGWGEERLKDPLNSAGAVNRRVEIVALGPFPKPDSSKRSPRRETGQKRIRW